MKREIVMLYRINIFVYVKIKIKDQLDIARYKENFSRKLFFLMFMIVEVIIIRIITAIYTHVKKPKGIETKNVKIPVKSIAAIISINVI